MKKPLGYGLLVAAALAAGSAAPSFGVAPGIIHGVNEQPLLFALAGCKVLESDARALAAAEAQGSPLSTPAGNAVATKINEALASLSDLKSALSSSAESLQDSTDVAGALKALDAAFDADGAVLNAIVKNQKAEKVVQALDKAADLKKQAGEALKGRPKTPKEIKTPETDPVEDDDFVSDADDKESKKDVKLTPAEIEAKKGDASGGRGWPGRERVYKYKELSAAGLTVAAKAPKPAPNYYFAFEGTGSTPGYYFKTFGRQLFGPFETRFQVGAFDYLDTGDTGSACIEFDVEGSSPLQFVAVCGRRINGGVQVFVQSHNGSAGSLFLAGTSIATVLVDYNGTTFTVKAASGRGAPDFVLSTVGTVNLTQGSTALIAGLGASGLTKGAEIGLDEIYIRAK